MSYNMQPPDKEFNGRLREAEKDIVELRTEIKYIREQMREIDEKMDTLIYRVEQNTAQQYGLILQLAVGALGGVIMWLAQIIGKKMGLM